MHSLWTVFKELCKIYFPLKMQKAGSDTDYMHVFHWFLKSGVNLSWGLKRTKEKVSFTAADKAVRRMCVLMQHIIIRRFMCVC